MSVPKDGVAANTHFLKLLPNSASVPPVDRIPLYEVYMRMAEELAKRSTCARLRVDKVVFISAWPGVMCAKLIINSGVTHVFYRKAYRDPSGIEVLEQGRVVPVLYDRWVGEWR